MPRTSSPSSSISPVWTPARISRPRSRIAPRIALAHRTARAGPSNVARNPSPVELHVAAPAASRFRVGRGRRGRSSSSGPRRVAESRRPRRGPDDVGEQHRGRGAVGLRRPVGAPAEEPSISCEHRLRLPSQGNASSPGSSTNFARGSAQRCTRAPSTAAPWSPRGAARASGRGSWAARAGCRSRTSSREHGRSSAGLAARRLNVIMRPAPSGRPTREGDCQRAFDHPCHGSPSLPELA